MESALNWATSGEGIAILSLAAVVIVVLVRWKYALRGWEGEVATDLTGELGIPTWAVQFLIYGSQGNLVAAAVAFKNGWQRIKTAAGLAEVDYGFMAKMKSDPNRWARAKAVFQAIDSGASQDQVMQLLTGALQASPLAKLPSAPTPLGVVKDDVTNAVQAVQAATHNDPVLSNIASALNAANLGHLFPLVAAGAQAAQAAPALPSGAAPPAQGTTPQPAPGTPTGGAGGADSAAGVSSTPAGHLTITAPPGTAIPAMQVPAAPAGA